jgi:formylglycine-generating enzyme required for sulfatase activity
MRRTALCLAALALAVAACDKGGTPPAAPPEVEAPKAGASIAEAPAPDMVTVPAGPFVLGSDEVDTEGRSQEFGGRRPWYEDEHPRQRMTLGTFRIDRTEVTEAAYAAFVREVHYPPPPDWTGTPAAPERPDLPVTQVNWMDAQNYCHWRGARLPSEFEWEKAARGPDGRVYPYGDTFDPERANSGKEGEIAPVGRYAGSASPYGAVDMAGNVWEWTSSWYLPYPGSGLQSPLFGRRQKVLRGGSAGTVGGHYLLQSLTSRASYRFLLDPRAKAADAGFRCVQTLDEAGHPIDDREARLHG